MNTPQSAINDNALESVITDAATVGLHTAGKVVETVGTVGKAVMSVKGTVGKSSISRMADDSILKFPTVISSAIDTDEAIPIAKMYEKQYASMLISIFSLRPAVSLNEYDNIAEYIKSIHTNKSIPSNLKKAQHFAKESYTGEADEEETLEISVEGKIIEHFSNAKEIALECWGVQGGQLNDTVLNDMVTPYRRTQANLRSRLDKAKAVRTAATEALSDVQKKAMGVVNVDRNNSSMINAKVLSSGTARDAGRNSIISNQKLLTLEPTMINVSFYLHGSKSGGAGDSASFTQNVVLGVKSMIRTVTPEYMITNLVEGSKSSNPIFKLIAWTRGEYKLVKDLLFNISETKKKFKDKRNDEYGFLDMSKNRKEIDDVSKYTGNRVLPYLSLVVTDYEVAQAAQITGVDLNNFRNAKNFMDKYYLLSFGIYNTSTKTLRVIFDGDDDFDSMSMSYMQSAQKQIIDINKSLSNIASIR